MLGCPLLAFSEVGATMDLKPSRVLSLSTLCALLPLICVAKGLLLSKGGLHNILLFCPMDTLEHLPPWPANGDILPQTLAIDDFRGMQTYPLWDL